MPLVVICGIPCSGKTTVAKKLAERLAAAGSTVQLINDESLLSNRADSYKDSVSEKMFRGKFKATVERYLVGDHVVIADSLNYIKGFRYELHCIARAAKTTQCVVYLDAPIANAAQRNADCCHYTPEMFKDLSSRMEHPNDRNRWDRPLINIVSSSEDIHFSDIENALFEGTSLKPSIATVTVQAAETNFRFEVDQITSEIVQAVMAGHQSFVPGMLVSVPKIEKKVRLNRRTNFIEMQKLRRQYIQIANLHPPKISEIGDSFVEYLNSNIL